MTAETVVRIAGTILAHGLTLYTLSTPSPAIKYPKTAWTAFSLFILILGGVLFYSAGAGLATFEIMMVIMIILYAVIFVWLSDYYVLESLFLHMSYVICFMLCVLLADIISVTFFEGGVWSGIIIRNLLSLAMYIVVRKVKKPLTDSLAMISSGWSYLLVFAMLAGFIVGYVSLSAIFAVQAGFQLAVFLIVSILMGASYAVVFFFVRLMVETERLHGMMVKQKLLERELSYEKKYAESCSRQVADMHKHNLKLIEILKEGGRNEAIRYLKSYDESLTSSSPGTWCRNRVVNALLRTCAGRCDDEGVDYHFDIRIPGGLPISDHEFTIVFGNILENAYNAALLSRKPLISVSMMMSGSLFLIELKNSFNGPVKWSGGLPRSSKPGGGLGLRSVKVVVEKHDGTMECDDTGGLFSVRIVLPMPRGMS